MTERPEDLARDDAPDPDRLADEEAAAAAQEAGAIGGPTPDPDLDPAERAVSEGGGGQAEGFELAEEQLQRQASHEDPGVDPSNERFAAEEEPATATYGEADEVDVTEVTSDPEAGEDDPGEGTPLAPDR